MTTPSQLTVRNLTLISYPLLSKDAQLQILDWRNHPTVRNVFIQHDIISEQTHLKFIENLKTDTTKCYWAVRHHDELVGSLDLYNITGTSAYWGFFLAPHLQKSALGALLEFVVIEIGFEQMHLKKLCCETLEFNESVLRMHRQFGFVETGREKDRVHMEIDANKWIENKNASLQLIEILLR